MVGADEMGERRPGDAWWDAIIIGCTIVGVILLIGWSIWIFLV
jgi:hypothetical protein